MKWLVHRLPCKGYNPIDIFLGVSPLKIDMLMHAKHNCFAKDKTKTLSGSMGTFPSPLDHNITLDHNFKNGNI